MSKVDVALCRKLATEIRDDLEASPDTREYEMTWGAASSISSQLLAAAELAEHAETLAAELASMTRARDELRGLSSRPASDQHDKDGLCPAVMSPAAQIEELEDAICTAIDALMVGIPAPEIIERLQVVLDDDDRKRQAERSRRRSLAARTALTEERAREVVREAALHANNPTLVDHETANAIADRAAKELAGSVVDADLGEALDRLHRCIVNDARDWSVSPRDAFNYAIAVGWGGAIGEVARVHGWSPDDVAEIERLGAAVARHRTASGQRPWVSLDRSWPDDPRAHAFDPAAVAVTARPASEPPVRLTIEQRTYPSPGFDMNDAVPVAPIGGWGPPDVQTVGIGPADTVLIDHALDLWSSLYNDAPHADIARIRALLASPGGGS